MRDEAVDSDEMLEPVEPTEGRVFRGAPRRGSAGGARGDTDAAVGAFQSQAGLGVDGVVGARTWAALG